MAGTASIGALELTDRHGDRVKLSDLWSDRSVVLAFIRHFG